MPKPTRPPTLIDTDAQRRVAPNVIDQRQQQIDPAGKHRVDPNAKGDTNMKQPGRAEDGHPEASPGDQDA